MMPRWIRSVNDGLRRDSCGCATGTVFLGVALVVATAWHVWHWEATRLAPWATAGRILGESMAAAIVGKIVGILRYQRSSRGRLIRTG